MFLADLIIYSNNQYGSTTSNIQQYLENLHMLSRVICMWPHQHHIDTLASKWELCQLLDLVAQERTKTAHPRTRLLVDGERLVNAMVLKRTHSDAGEHVVVLSNVYRCN